MVAPVPASAVNELLDRLLDDDDPLDDLERRRALNQLSDWSKSADNETAAKAHSGLAILAEARGDFEAALRHGRSATGRCPKDPLYINNLATTLGAMDRSEEALEKFEEAVQLSQRRNALFLANMALCLLVLERRDDAVQVLQEAVKKIDLTDRIEVQRIASIAARFAEGDEPILEPLLTIQSKMGGRDEESSHRIELTPEGAAVLGSILDEPARTIPALVELLRGA